MFIRVDFQQLFFDKQSLAAFYLYFFKQPSPELSRMYAVCVHGDTDDRMAAGPGNIFNEWFRGEVVTTWGIDVTLSCSSRDRDPSAH